MLPPELAYLALTRSIIPVTVDKVGMIKWKEFQDRRMSIEELERYIDEAPAWAQVTGKISGIFTIDIDPAGIEWAETREIAKLAHRRTPSGGLHIDVTVPDSWELGAKNTVSALSKGVDTRGEGGIALVWGRTRRGRYEWIRNPKTSPTEFGSLPYPVRNILESVVKKEPERVVDIDFSSPTLNDEGVQSLILVALSRATISGRNPMGFWLARKLRDGGIPKEDARLAGYQYVRRVFDTNTHGVREPYTDRMFDAALDNAYSRVPR